jgi:hypothetical protein
VPAVLEISRANADPVLDPSHPAHLNAYTYGFDNPIGSPDPTGLEPQLSECSGADDRLACEIWRLPSGENTIAHLEHCQSEWCRTGATPLAGPAQGRQDH